MPPVVRADKQQSRADGEPDSLDEWVSETGAPEVELAKLRNKRIQVPLLLQKARQRFIRLMIRTRGKTFLEARNFRFGGGSIG